MKRRGRPRETEKNIGERSQGGGKFLGRAEGYGTEPKEVVVFIAALLPSSD